MKLYDVGTQPVEVSGKPKKYYPSINVESGDIKGIDKMKVGTTFKGMCEMVLIGERINIRSGKTLTEYTLEIRKVGVGNE